MIKSSIKHAETTISNLYEMINNYENDLLKFQLLRFSPTKSFERLDELLQNEDYFQAYSKKYSKENVNTYNSLSLIIYYFHMQINQLWEIIEKAQEFNHKRKIKFNEQSTFIITLVAISTVNPNTGISVEDLATLNTILVDFHEKITEDVSLVYLYEFNRRVLENVLIHYIGNPIAMQIIELSRDSSVLFDEIHKQNTSHKNDLVGIKNEMNEVVNRYKRTNSKSKMKSSCSNLSSSLVLVCDEYLLKLADNLYRLQRGSLKQSYFRNRQLKLYFLESVIST